MIALFNCTPEQFAEATAAYRDAQPPTSPQRLCVSAYSAHEYRQLAAAINGSTVHRCYLERYGNAGYAITFDGELVSLWSRARGYGQAILTDAIARGATHLHCYDGPLRDIYERAGFRVDGRAPFDPSLAPDGWPASMGTPDYLHMTLTPTTED